MARSYKAQLDAQNSFRSNMPAGNMTQAEKSMNKLDLHAYKYSLNVDGSIVPGVVQVKRNMDPKKLAEIVKPKKIS